jgi:acyl-CoA thioester hydrolase
VTRSPTTRRGAAHRFPVRVYYEDTDAGGIVYHAQYLCFAERARTELLREAGADHRSLLAQHGGVFAVRRAVVDFRRAARLDDPLVVESRVERCGGARLALRQEIKRAGEPIVLIEVELAFISLDLRPRRLPSPLIAGFDKMDLLPSTDA